MAGEIAGPGFGAGLPLAGPGFQKNFNLDFGGGLGVPGLGGGFPGWGGGGGGGYIPMTPLGAMGGLKGDLIVPMVAIGVALFLLVLIVLAVKYALAWKLSVLEDLSGPKKWKREAGSAAAPQLEEDYMMQLAKIVTSAIYSGSCSDRMICEVGAFARGNAQTVKGLISMVDSFVPANYHSYLEILRASAEGTVDCAQKYQCNTGPQKPQDQSGQDGQTVSGDKAGATPSTPTPVQVTPSPLPGQQQQQPQAQTPRPMLKDMFKAASAGGGAANGSLPVQKMGKFRRHIE